MNKISLYIVLIVGVLLTSFSATYANPSAYQFCQSVNSPIYEIQSDRVRDLQLALREIRPSMSGTGYYGPVTRNVVKLYQQIYGISQTGYVGPVTLRSMRNNWCHTSGQTAVNPSLNLNMVGSSVVKMGQTIEMAYYVNNNFNNNTQVTISTKRVSKDVSNSGVGGGKWQSKILSTGSSNGIYNARTGDGYLNIPGEYKITAQLRDCDPRGCDYNPDFDQSFIPKVYARSLPVYITVSDQVPVSNNSPFIHYFNSNTVDIVRGEGVLLQWSAVNSNRCFLSGGIYGGINSYIENDFDTNHFLTVYPNVTTEYNLACKDYSGQRSEEKFVTIYVR